MECLSGYESQTIWALGMTACKMTRLWDWNTAKQKCNGSLCCHLQYWRTALAGHRFMKAASFHWFQKNMKSLGWAALLRQSSLFTFNFAWFRHSRDAFFVSTATNTLSFRHCSHFPHLSNNFLTVFFAIWHLPSAVCFLLKCVKPPVLALRIFR